jgi:hypothetical protein
MKKSLKGEAFLSPVIYWNSYHDQLTREAFQDLEPKLKENFKKETGKQTVLHHIISKSFFC